MACPGCGAHNERFELINGFPFLRLRCRLCDEWLGNGEDEEDSK